MDDLIAENELGARKLDGLARRIFLVVAVLWPIFQLYIVSPLPFLLDFVILDSNQQRSIHLAFALFLGFLAFPAFRSSSRHLVPSYDWILATIAVGSCLYLLVSYAEIMSRTGGMRTSVEVAVSVVGLLMVLELARRVLGLPMVVVALVFSAYVFLGRELPDLISHRGFSLNRYVEHMWLTPEGVFGLPLGVSNSFIFLFVLFGALLDKAGAGQFFLKISFALLGHMRGGPAKAAVVSSGLTGLVSGSAIANVVTTGTFTIPLMKRIGFSREKAGAIEVAASINGQIMPPVMGAAAFLMTEFVGITYQEVIIHAFLPAAISYIALFYIVHLEALKANMPLIERTVQSSIFRKIGGVLAGFGTIAAISGLVYLVAMTLKTVVGDYATPVAGLLIVGVYFYLLTIAARYPDLEADDPSKPITEIPELRPTLMAGLHYIIPIGVLIWSLMIERLSPGLSVSWATLVLAAIILTQRPLLVLFRGQGNIRRDIHAGVRDLFQGFVAGSRNMIGVAIAMAAAGIVVGVVSLTGLGLLMTEVINAVSGGNVLLMLLCTALMCVLLGMGLPTTANYIVVASVMAQPLVILAAQNGLVIPLFAVHLFVFYFGLISGVTPPVAVDAYAGAAVARSNPTKTCLQAFYYALRTAILPFIFVFNPEILLIGIENAWHGALVVISATIAMLAFAAGTQGYFFSRSRLWESLLLIVLAFSLLRPGLWLDQIQPPYTAEPPAKWEGIVEDAPNGSRLRLVAEGENFSGDSVRSVVALPLGKKESEGGERLWKNAGVRFQTENEVTVVDSIRFGAAAEQAGLGMGWEIVELQRPNNRNAKEWFYIPAYLILILLAWLQLRRRERL